MSERVRATLGFLEKLTLRPEEVGPRDLEPLRAAGVSDAAIEDAVHVCAGFSMIVRLADTLAFELPTAAGYAAAAARLLKRGYA